MRKLGGRLGVSRRLAIIAGLATVLAIAATGTVLADPSGWFGGGNDNPWPYNSPGPAPVLAAVGDISCQPGKPEEAEKKTDTCDQGSGSTLRDEAQNPRRAITSSTTTTDKPAFAALATSTTTTASSTTGRTARRSTPRSQTRPRASSSRSPSRRRRVRPATSARPATAGTRTTPATGI